MAAAPVLLLPACGEKVGMRGRFHKLRLVEAPPHPGPLHSPSKTGVNALTASGEREQKRRPYEIALPQRGGQKEASA